MNKAVEGDQNLSLDYLNYYNKQSKETKAIIDEDAAVFLHQAMSTPVLNVIKTSNKSQLIMLDDQEILDFHGNSVHQFGYDNSFIKAALINQLNTLEFSPRRYTNEVSIKAAQSLVELTNNELSRVLFTTSGSASISIALKVARLASQKNKVVTTYNSFHGANLDTIKVGGLKEFKNKLGYFESNLHFLPYDPYNCPLGQCNTCDYLCLQYLDYQLDNEDDYGALLMEPIRATNLYIPPNEYFLRIKEIVTKHNLLLIFDEIPLSLLKTQEYFVYQNYDITPDILVLGKGLGAGLIPFSAVLMKEEYNVAQDISLGHYTHEKNPLGAAVLLAALEYIDTNNLKKHVKELNTLIKEKLIELDNCYNFIINSRCIGNMFAIEIDLNKIKQHNLVYLFIENKLNIKISNNNILLFMPPLVISHKQIRETFVIINKIFKEIEVI